jgi:N-acetyltransferase
MKKFDLQPTLKGKLLELRPLLPDDFENLFAAASDPLIWEVHPEPNRYTRPVFKIYFQGALDSKGALVAIDLKTNKIIGGSRFHHFDPATDEVTIGFTFLERKYWGGAFNGEMKKLMLEHAFKFVRYVNFRIGEKNIRSRKAVEKIGAKFIKVDEQPSFGHVHVIYRIERK